MNVNPVSTNINFNGKVIVKGNIGKTYMCRLVNCKDSLDTMIKDLPFDLVIVPSKSKKRVLVSASVKDEESYVVSKRAVNFKEAANLALADGKQKSELYQRMAKTNEMFEYSRQSFLNVMTGNFKEARRNRQELAKLAIEDFEAYKSIPKINFTNAPISIMRLAFINGLKYRVYNAFTSKTNEEKTFTKMCKEYMKELKAGKKQIKTVNIPFPRYF